MVFATSAYGMIAMWYIWPALSQKQLASALQPLLLHHCFRILGLAFLIPGVTAQALDPRFSFYAAYGDLLAASLAFASIVALRRNWNLAIPLIWIMNIVGASDFASSMLRGLMFVPPGHMGATFFIPLIMVPAYLVNHAMMFALLARRRMAAPAV
jgi:hypothetical protein